MQGWALRPRECRGATQPRKCIADISIAKQRNGPIGDFPLTFVGRYTKFENWVPDTYGDFPDEGYQ